VQPDDAKFETDFEKLAARFAAQSGGGLSPELSSDLALQIVLNEIVEEACLVTGATGAAIVLPRDGEMICRASSGSTAPDLGARLDTSAGLSGECFNTRRTQRCDDVLEDPRVDLEASSRLGVCSLMVLPLLNGTDFGGILEVFSSRPAAFGDRDQLTLETLGQRILSNIERAAKPLSVPFQDPQSHPKEETWSFPDEIARPLPVLPISDDAPPSGRAVRAMTWVLGSMVLIAGAWMGARVAQLLGWNRISVHTHSAEAAARSSSVSPFNNDAVAESAHNQSAPVMPDAEKPTSVNATGVHVPPAGGLSVYENGREVFRMRPAKTGQSVQPNMVEQTAASVEPDRAVEVSPTAAEGILLRRVEPDYPEAARERQIQGSVVVDVRIGQDGAVQDIKVISGDLLLAQASEAAVKQWRFKPYMVDGRAVEMQTRVTLNFSLPR
jgi:TonB family protein